MLVIFNFCKISILIHVINEAKLFHCYFHILLLNRIDNDSSSFAKMAWYH
jgi:hypothetical protein